MRGGTGVRIKGARLDRIGASRGKMPAMVRTSLRAWTESAGLRISDEAWDRLERLIGLWQQYGRAINLVGATDHRALVDHVQEGLQCVACVEKIRPVDARCRWIDVGTGGGLPGLVVAAVRPCEMILIEPRERRAAFLDLGLAAIGMGGGRVIRARWSVSTWNEKVITEQEPRTETTFYILSSRAVFTPEIWLREASRVQITRGITLCHVDSSATGVAEKEPSAVVRGPRWGVMGFATNSE